MKWFDWIFKKEKLQKLNCGCFNTETGEFKQGYKNETGDVIYIPEGTQGLWSEPEYIGCATQWQEWAYIWSDKYHRQEWKRPIYKETNNFSKKSRYFYINADNIHRYMVPEAFEKDGTIILI